MVQVPPAAKVAGLVGQALAPVLVAANSPEAANELIGRAAAPVFVSVTVIGALVVASSWLPKSRPVGANPTPGEFEPVPLRLTFCGLFKSRSEEHTSELQSRLHLVCRLLLEKKKKRHTCFALQKHCPDIAD